VIRGVHVLALTAIVLAALAVHSTESYTTRYQTLPVLDWLQSRPPLVESTNVPAAADLARGLARVVPWLVIRADVRPLTPLFTPPAIFQRTIPGVRDAARIELGTPGAYPALQIPVQARFDAIVFDRTSQAAVWVELLGREMDIKDPENLRPQERIAGPDEPDTVWVVSPSGQKGGIATVVGHRGPVGFVLQVTYLRSDVNDPATRIDLTSRAETAARQAANDWSAWLSTQLAAP
jgi:hypothetical protein